MVKWRVSIARQQHTESWKTCEDDETTEDVYDDEPEEEEAKGAERGDGEGCTDDWPGVMSYKLSPPAQYSDDLL